MKMFFFMTIFARVDDHYTADGGIPGTVRGNNIYGRNTQGWRIWLTS